MKENFSQTKIFTIILALFYIFGLVGTFYEKEILFSFLVFALLSILILFINIGFKKSIILFLIFFAGLIRAKYSQNIPNALDGIFSNEAEITGQIISSKDISDKTNKIKFYLRADNAKIYGKEYKDIDSKFLISIDNLNDIEKDISIGDYAYLKGKLRHPSPATNPHQFDYQKYLLNHNVKNILYAESFEKIKDIYDGKELKDRWYQVLNFFETTRNKIIEKHSKYIKSPNLEILGGIVFGNETINPDEQTKENFKISGLLHLLAASGLNVALIYGIWWWIASLIRFPYNLSILIGASFVILYTFMTGFPPSILRASIMLLFVLLGKIIDRNANSLALIFFVGLLLLIINPKMLFDVGFQLSFVVTIGLVTCCPVIISKFEKLDEKYKEKYKNASRFQKYLFFLFSPKSLVAIVAVPLVAQLFVIPLQMHYFNNFAPFSLFANIAVVPFIGVLSFIGFISSIFALIPFLNEPIIYLFDFIANPMLDLLVNISAFFASFKLSLISTIGLNVYQIFLFWLVVFLAILNLKNNFKNKKDLTLVLISILVFFFSFIKFNPVNTLEIIMFDVGNADSFLIKTPKNKFIMIDTGKKSYKGTSSAQVIMNKYLKNERISKLEKLIITHFDADHCAGTIDILENFKVKEVIIPSQKSKSEISDEILKYLKDNKVNHSLVKNNNEIFKEENLSIKTLNSNSKDENESSIVTLASYSNKNILFMGDVGIVGFKEINKNIPEKIEILKIGHHGAKNSIDDKMIKSLKPKYALISAGFSKFNHPHYSTIDILNKNNVNIISTKTHGFSKIVLKENSNEIFHYDSKLKKLKLFTHKNINETFSENDYFENFIKKYSK
ncbi:MAG: DNA internalization-related competence protein ComEC/Rec2 [Candidatus Gastranaerophilales bacterium]|nr:DNA internalization-related competence protein ComEC/Rec2 [Candidatus Gastranaerophilales bacterium]